MEDETTNLFVYGILCNPETVRRITGTTFQSEKAILVGYEKLILAATAFILPCYGMTTWVEGMVLYDVDKYSLSYIDHVEHEGSAYVRTKVSVAIENSSRAVDCECYVAGVWAAEYLNRNARSLT